MKLAGGVLVSPGMIAREDIYINAGHLSYVIPNESVPKINCSGCVILPGFVDQHVHGAMGVDVSDCTVEDLRRLSLEFARHGVTGFLPTLTTRPKAQLLSALRTIASCADNMHGAAILGIHMEGPCLSAKYRGAQDIASLALPSVSDFKEYIEASGNLLRIVTLAPELEGAEALIKFLRDKEICISIGHSAATFDQTARAFAAGAGSVTHCLNGMREFHQREPSILGAAILGDVMAEVICDGCHLVPPAIAVLDRIMGLGRLILITDAIPAAGLPDGEYSFPCFGEPVRIVNGNAHLAITGSRAGGTIFLDQMLRNYLAFTGRTLEEVSACISFNPARNIGFGNKGSLAEGADADLTVLDAELQVVYTIVGGRLVYPDNSVNPKSL